MVVAGGWTAERLAKYRELLKSYHRARRQYVLSDECPPRSLFRSVCWECGVWVALHLTTVNGEPHCSKCGAHDPAGHRDRLLDEKDRADWETVERFEEILNCAIQGGPPDANRQRKESA